MSVFRDIKITWKGEEYWLSPNNRLLRRIEAELSPSSLTNMIARIGSAKPPISEVAFVVSELLKAAGAKDVGEDQIYADLMTDLMENEGNEFSAMCGAIVAVISPADDDKKKSPSTSKTTKTTKTTKARQNK